MVLGIKVIPFPPILRKCQFCTEDICIFQVTIGNKDAYYCKCCFMNEWWHLQAIGWGFEGEEREQLYRMLSDTVCK